MNYSTEIYTIKNPTGSLRAYGSLVIEINSTTTMKIKGFKIFEGKNGLFAKPPQTKGKDKEGNDTWYDDIQFVDSTDEQTFRNEVYQTFVNDYSQKQGASHRNSAASSQTNYNKENKSQKQTPLW